MATYKLFLLPGDGIGPEVMAEVEKVASACARLGLARFETEKGLVGGCAYDAHGAAISRSRHGARRRPPTRCCSAAVGGPKWDGVPYEARPEAGLLRLRKDLALYANLRPAICYPALADASSLKREVVEGLDIMIVRELTGGVYFGEPKQIIDLGNGQKRAHRHPGLRHLRNRAHRPRRLRSRAQAPQQGDLVREAQRDEVGRAVAAKSSSPCTSANSPTSSSSTSSPTRSACSSCAGRSSSTSSSPTICSATCCPTSPRC